MFDADAFPAVGYIVVCPVILFCTLDTRHCDNGKKTAEAAGTAEIGVNARDP